MPPNEPLHRVARASKLASMFEDDPKPPNEIIEDQKQKVSVKPKPEKKKTPKPILKPSSEVKEAADKPKTNLMGQGAKLNDGSVYAHVQIFLTPADLSRANDLCKLKGVTLDYLSTWICQQIGDDIKNTIVSGIFPEISKEDCTTRKSPHDGTSIGMVSVGAPIGILKLIKDTIGDPFGIILDRTVLREITRKIAPTTIQRLFGELETK